jgi:hypothetical protein
MSILVNLGADGAVLGGELSLSRQVGRRPILAKRDRIRDGVGVCEGLKYRLLSPYDTHSQPLLFPPGGGWSSIVALTH